MHVPLSWLREYIPKLPAAETLADRLALHGLEVDDILRPQFSLDKVIVGEIIDIRPHPNADKLRIADVRLAANAQPQAIVCGAPNIAVGQKVPVALVGATLPNGVTIEARPIRGVVSAGMICAADELGLGEDHSGVLVLDAHTKLGIPVATVLGVDDVVFDIVIPANRADLLSIHGLAREIAAILHEKVQLPAIPKVPTSSRRGPAVTVLAKKTCAQYNLVQVDGLRYGTTPQWMQNRLRKSGLRPIQPIVDITNYVMLLTGQPLHAFDAAKVQGKIRVRSAERGERLMTLDRVARTLSTEMQVIADDRGPIALAGIMGGAETEVTADTTSILLEAAVFHPVATRRAARALGLGTDAAKRFERGLWNSAPLEALGFATQLLKDICGARVSSAVTSIGNATIPRQVIQVDPALFADRLGQPVRTSQAKTTLRRLGFSLQGSTTRWSVSVPSWRLDVQGPEDLVDEIGRMTGYAHTPEDWPATTIVPAPLSEVIRGKQDIRTILTRLGLIESISHSYYSAEVARSIDGEHIAVANPLDATQQFLRRSLGPAIDRVLERAADAGDDAAVFEIGRIFVSAQEQPWMLAIGCEEKLGATVPPHWPLLGILDQLCASLRVPRRSVHITRTATRVVRGRTVAWLECDIRQLLRDRVPQTTTIERFPAVSRDISFTLDTTVAYETVQKVFVQHGHKLLRDVQVIDMRQDQGKYGYTVRCRFVAEDRTLTKTEVDGVEERLRTALKNLGAGIR